ncbi:T9SS type A sorting domain-containing protein [Portibacter lacus]|uniref:T9SS type A sorting domain-containing protein n=1 Tax=Portibacter lacus TaxID=1099794 RepID=A0AA37STS4_9BACT|nr:T9SS type A sorting domain-containing protein [Portibacter lacus]GLR19464.1 hypothetical protein GCM10007940_40800 [Portibacter lacus]
MKIIFRLVLVLCLSLQVGIILAQKTKSDLKTKIDIQTKILEKAEPTYPNYRLMMSDPSYTLDEIRAAFNQYYKDTKMEKRGEYKQFKRWEYFAMLKADKNGKIPSDYSIQNEVRIHKKQNPEMYRSASASWSQMGPIDYPSNATTQPTGLGRINSVEIDPTNANTIYVGTSSGGLWKSTNGGSSWSTNTDNLASLGVSTIVANGNTVWIGTGDRDGHHSSGVGILKSTNGGNSFTSMNTGIPTNYPGFLKINEILIEPGNSSNMYIGTGLDVFKSTNGGASWGPIATTVYTNVIDMAFKPSDANTVYWTNDTGNFYRTTNGGATVSETTLPVPGGVTNTRLFIATTPLDPTYVYVVASRSDSRYGGLYLSTDSGATFTAMSTNNGSNNIFGYESGTDDAGQGGYDLCITVDPSNKNTIYVGSINIWKSTDAGVNWVKKSHWGGVIGNIDGLHADQHFFTWSTDGSKLYIGNDSGIYYSTDKANTYTNISSGLAIAQAYKIGASYYTPGLIMAGFQDNGAARRDVNGQWTTVMGGDGTESAIDPQNDANKFFCYVQGDLRRTINNGFEESIKGNINEDGPWVTPYTLDSYTTGLMYAGYKNVWRTSNSVTPGVVPTWVKISNGITGSGLDLEVSLANENILYYSTSDGKLYRCDDAKAQFPSQWTTLTLPAPGVTVNAILPDATNANVVWIAHNNKVYKSMNKGGSWTNISSGLPNIPTNALAQYVPNPETIYVGMEAGVYILEAGASSWTSFATNLPSTLKITELEFQYYPASLGSSSIASRHPNDRLIAATFGRGIWQSPPGVGVLPVTFESFTGRKESYNSVNLNWTTGTELNNEKFIIERSVNGEDFKSIGVVNGSGTSSTELNYSFTDRNPDEGYNYYRLKQFDFDGQFFYSNIIAINFAANGFKGVSIFPNPTSNGELTVDIDKQFEGSFDIKVYTLNGAMVYEKLNVVNGQYKIDTNGFANGMYILEVKNPFVINTQKFIVK